MGSIPTAPTNSIKQTIMLTNLSSIKFIGDLSLQDADVLSEYGKKSKTVLEFGVGGSTQILSQCGCESITCIETDPYWIDLTSKRLAQIDNASKVEFFSYDQLDAVVADKQYDLIFVDGIDYLRRDFAVKTWQNLKVNGIMLFHDTRRFEDFQNSTWVAQLYFNEISKIDVNIAASNGKSSNMTIIHKKSFEPWENWNYTENKPLWAYGKEPKVEDLPLWHQHNRI